MWQLSTGQAFTFRQYDDEFVFYNDLTGATHLLADSAVHLLSVLQQGAQSGESLCAALALALDCPRNGAFDRQTDAVIAQLAALSLICRA